MSELWAGGTKLFDSIHGATLRIERIDGDFVVLKALGDGEPEYSAGDTFRKQRYVIARQLGARYLYPEDVDAKRYGAQP